MSRSTSRSIIHPGLYTPLLVCAAGGCTTKCCDGTDEQVYAFTHCELEHAKGEVEEFKDIQSAQKLTACRSTVAAVAIRAAFRIRQSEAIPAALATFRP